MPLTPNNRNEAWMKGMVDGSTDLTPNNRKEHWYKEIVDAIGSGGGGGTGGGAFVVNTVDGDELTLDKTWQDIKDAYDAGSVVMMYDETAIGYLTLIKPPTPPIGLSYEVVFIEGGESMPFSCDTANDYPVFIGE